MTITAPEPTRTVDSRAVSPAATDESAHLRELVLAALGDLVREAPAPPPSLPGINYFAPTPRWARTRRNVPSLAARRAGRAWAP